MLVEDVEKDTWSYRSIGDIIAAMPMLSSEICIFHIGDHSFIRKDNAAYGMTAAEIYRYLYRKYIRIKRHSCGGAGVLQLMAKG